MWKVRNYNLDICNTLIVRCEVCQFLLKSTFRIGSAFFYGETFGCLMKKTYLCRIGDIKSICYGSWL